MDIRLELLKPQDEEQFIKDNQAAFIFERNNTLTNKN